MRVKESRMAFLCKQYPLNCYDRTLFCFCEVANILFQGVYGHIGNTGWRKAWCCACVNVMNGMSKSE